MAIKFLREADKVIMRKGKKKSMPTLEFPKVALPKMKLPKLKMPKLKR